jgi:GTPase
VSREGALAHHDADKRDGLGSQLRLHLVSNMTDGKQHVSIVICGHVDAGKSTTTGRLIFELGGLPERELQKLKDEADRLGKVS